MTKTVSAIVAIAVISWGSYYLFIDTLSFAEIVGRTGSATGDIMVNLFDFDTGLTRYDAFRLARYCDAWNARMAQIDAIRNPVRQQAECDKLFAEMMQDPSFKKVARGVLGLSAKAAITIMRMIASAG